MAPRVAIVTTTIYVPKALENYFKNAVEHGYQDTLFVVTGDKKTPAEAKPFTLKTAQECGVQAVFMDVDDQNEYMKKYPELNAHLPWNCIQRRNVSILYAYEQGCEIIIAIDDDNLCDPRTNYIGEHLAAFDRPQAMPELSSTSGWLNICKFLRDKRGVPFYPRGFPMEQRWPQFEPGVSSRTNTRRVVVNGGLWLDDPDVDAFTRLCNNISAIEYTREDNFALAKGTWCPYNSQNTAIHRDVIAGYVLSPNVGRMDDIWGGYVTLAIMDHLGHCCSFGHPLVVQERNPHNYFRDHEKEAVGLEAGTVFTEALRSIKLTCTNYNDGIAEVSAALRQMQERFTPAAWGHVTAICDALDVWVATIKRADAARKA